MNGERSIPSVGSQFEAGWHSLSRPTDVDGLSGSPIFQVNNDVGGYNSEALAKALKDRHSCHAIDRLGDAMQIGYMRVSKADGSQSTDLQRDALRAAGVATRRLYADRASGRQCDRAVTTNMTIIVVLLPV